MPPAKGQPAPAFESRLFDAAFLRQMERLRILAQKIQQGKLRGERRSRHTGASLEFADYRNYADGDDPRTIDWHAYGRLDRLFIKLFEEEEDLDISFLIDASASMRWRPERMNPGTNKFDYARLLAGALAYVGLCSLDRVNLWFFDRDLRADLGFLRGRSALHAVLRFLENPPSTGDATSLAKALGHFATRLRRRGLVVVISDFLDPAGWDSALGKLLHAGFEVEVIHLLDPAERNPSLLGDFDLIDCEGGERLRVTLSPARLQAYQEELDTHCRALRTFCRRHGAGHTLAGSDEPIDRVLANLLKAGVLE